MIDVATISSIAFRAIKANKMRSILTSLGIIIGVAAVIVMLAIGNGAQISIQNEMKTMGANLIIVRSGVATSSGARSGHGSRPSMRKSDGDAIQEKFRKFDWRLRYWKKLPNWYMAMPTGQPGLREPTTGILRLRNGNWSLAGTLVRRT